MAETVLPIGMSKTLVQNKSYALPAKPCVVSASAAIEQSFNESAWSALASGTLAGAPFLRSTLAGTIVNCKPASMAGSGMSFNSKGITASDYIAVGANPAQSGSIRLNSGEGIKVRNTSNNGDVKLIGGYSTVVEIGEGQLVMSYGPIGIGLTPAQSGALRLAKDVWITARNAANSGDYNIIRLNSAVGIEIGQSSIPTYSLGLLKPANGILFGEQTSLGAAPVDSAHMWLQDNGSGKTQLMVQFNTGAAIQIAIQP